MRRTASAQKKHRDMNNDSSFKKVLSSNDMDYEYLCARLMHMMFKLMGIAPLTIARQHHRPKVLKNKICQTLKSTKFVYSKVGSLYNVFLIVFAVGINILSMIYHRRSENDCKTPLSVEFIVIQNFISNVIILGIWLLLCVKQRTTVNLLNRLTNVDCTLFDLSGGRNIESAPCYFFFLIVSNITIHITIFVIDTLYYKIPPINWFNTIVPSLIVSWFTISYIVTIKLIEVRYRALNRALLDNARSSNVIPIASFVVENVTINHLYSSIIVTFRRSHAVLYEISNEVAEFYSLPILPTIAISCYSIVYNAYYAVMPFVLEVDEDPVIMIVYSLSRVATLMLPIMMLSAGVDRILCQMKKTTDIVHKLLVRPNIGKQEKLELEEFSLELLQRHVEFTANGLFTLNCTLVHSIFSTLATYLIIMFQFQAASKEKKRLSIAQKINNYNK